MDSAADDEDAIGRHSSPNEADMPEFKVQHESYIRNPQSCAMPGSGEPFQLYAPPIINGVPKILFTDEEVAAMYGFSVSTVRNRYKASSRWYDPDFPVPRTTDGSGEGRKAAIRWHWTDLCIYAANLPFVAPIHQFAKRIKAPNPLAPRGRGTKPFVV